MRKPRIDGQNTRTNLLLAAGEIFAARGFRNATIAEICTRAKANQAAANYHFGSKEALYIQSWRFAFERSLSKYPADGGVGDDAGLELRLRGRILAMMQRIVDPQSHDLDILYKELANPTGLLTMVLEQALEPILKGFSDLVRELLGPDAEEQQVRLCLMSIRAQCFGPMMRQRRRKKEIIKGPEPGQEPIMDDVQALAEHVTRFSLAGIRDIQLQIRKNRKNYAITPDRRMAL